MVCPTKRQHDARVQSRKLLVRRISVATDDAAFNARQLVLHHLARTRLIEHVVNYRGGVKHPQIPPMADLARHINEHRPTRLIGMPVLLATQLGHQRQLQGRKQRRKRLQAACQCPRRHVQPVIGQILQQAMTGAAIQEFVQQHAAPYRYPELAALDQPRRGRRCHDARNAAAVAHGSITPPADHAPVGLDLNLQHLRVFGAGELAQTQATLGAPWRVEFDHLDSRGQVRLHRASMARCATLLPARRT